MSKREPQRRPNRLLWIALPAIIYSLNLISFSNGEVSYILPDEFSFAWQQDEVLNEYVDEDQFIPSSEYPLSYSHSLSRADDELPLEMEPIPMDIPMNDLDSRLRMVLVEDDYYYDNNNGDLGPYQGRRGEEDDSEDGDEDDDDFDADFDKKEDFDDDKELNQLFNDDYDVDDYPYGYGGYNENFGKVKDKKGPRRKNWNYKNYNQYSYHKYDKHPLDKYGRGWTSRYAPKQSHTYHKYTEHPLEKYEWDDNHSKVSSGLAHTFTYLKRKFAEKNAQHYHHHGHHGGHGGHHLKHYGWGSSGYPYPEFSAGLSDTYGFLKNKIAHKNAFHHHNKHYGW